MTTTTPSLDPHSAYIAAGAALLADPASVLSLNTALDAIYVSSATGTPVTLTRRQTRLLDVYLAYATAAMGSAQHYTSALPRTLPTDLSATHLPAASDPWERFEI